jgi:uncharacterized protein (TIGR03435 family)
MSSESGDEASFVLVSRLSKFEEWGFKQMRGILAIMGAGFVLATLIATAQTPPPTEPPTFEVASVKQNLNPNPLWHMSPTLDGVDAIDVTLQYAIRQAYGVYDDKLSSGGPAWLNERRFDIQAKFDVSKYPNPTREQRQAMLQQLLADRFKLVVHHQTREFPLYALVVAKNGPKIQESKPEDIHRSGLDGRVMCHLLRSRPGDLAFQGCYLQSLLTNLAFVPDVGRTVVDKTGLAGLYTFELKWTPDNPSASASPDLSAPSIFTALQEQLGLKLESTKVPLDTIVIDHVEMPSEN